MCEADVGPNAAPLLFTFQAGLKQHLTELTITIYPDSFEVQRLGALAMLPALQTLEVKCYRHTGLSLLGPEAYLNLLGEELAWELPHLVFLWLEGFQQGQVVVACPRLAKAELFDTISFGINIGDAVLTSLKLESCEEVQIAMNSDEEQLQSLKTLIVKYCSEVA